MCLPCVARVLCSPLLWGVLVSFLRVLVSQARVGRGLMAPDPGADGDPIVDTGFVVPLSSNDKIYHSAVGPPIALRVQL